MSNQPEHELASRTYNELTVITKGKKLALLVYTLCRQLPDYEKFGLCSQMQRASVSIASNIAEGQQRSDKDFARFVTIARGSLFELKVQLDIANELYYEERFLGSKNDLFIQCYDLIEEIGKMTYKLSLKLNADAGGY